MVRRLVTIDFWGTLVVDPPLFDDHYRRHRLTRFQQILGSAGEAVTLPALDRAYDRSATSLVRRWEQNRDVSVEQHVRALLDAVERQLTERLAETTLVELVDAYAAPITIAPPTIDAGAYAALQRLTTRGYALGIVSNTMRSPGSMLRRVLDQYRVLPFFSVLTFSDECGIRKPDPEIFALTLRAAGADREAAIHVGDDPILDVDGARGAGIRVIQVRRRRPPGTDDPKPDAVIEHLLALPDAVQELDQPKGDPDQSPRGPAAPET